MTFKQAEKALRERGLALAYGPHGSRNGQSRWFAATEYGEVIAEASTWVAVVHEILEGKSK